MTTNVFKVSGSIPMLSGAILTTGIASGGTGNFFADPFSAYTSNYIADTTFGGTAGTSTTVSWNGATVTGPTYSTAQAAITAAAAHLVASSQSTRVCLLAGQTHNLTSQPLFIPSNTGTVASAATPFVIQGDPAASASTMPQINGQGTAEGIFAIGSAPSGSVYGGSNDNRNTVIRKIDGHSVTGYILCPGAFGSGQFSGLIVEFCKMHNIVFSTTAGEGGAGPVYQPNRGVTDTFEIRYSKLYDNIGDNGTTANKPFAAVETYGGAFNIHHNEVYTNPCFFAGKCLTSVVPNGTIHHNYVHDCGNSSNGMIEGEAGGGGPGFNGCYVYNNLFGWEGINDTVYGPPASQIVYNDFGTNGNNTAPTDIRFYNNTIVKAIGNAGNITLSNINTSAVQVYNNVILGPSPMFTDEQGHLGQMIFVDYNVYFNPTSFYMMFEGASQTQFTSLAQWKLAHTNHPSFPGLTADPDAHATDINLLGAPWNTIAANFPNSGTFGAGNYGLAGSSPLKGAGQGGVDPGYDPNDCGPGW
jgi:hypothetical protein